MLIFLLKFADAFNVVWRCPCDFNSQEPLAHGEICDH